MLVLKKTQRRRTHFGLVEVDSLCKPNALNVDLVNWQSKYISTWM